MNARTMSDANARSRTNLLVAGVFTFLLTTFFSEGYHHPDEHFQILEFANVKLGGAPAADLPWEFAARIRPALQPTIAWGAIKAMQSIGLQDPFTQVMMLRMLTALLSVFLFRALAEATSHSLSANHGSEVLLSLAFLLWFMPYLQVRFSSECWSGLAFLASVFYLLRFEQHEQQRLGTLFVAGALSSCSFFLRFQMSFAILGVLGWLYWRKAGARALLAFIAGGVLVAAASVTLDRWFYGDWVLTPYRYLEANIFQNIAAQWGVSPWWFYVPAFVVKGAPPLSLLLLGFFGYGVVLQRKHLFAWALVPFLLGHLLIGHKELRFLFPMVFPFLYFVAAGWLKAGPLLLQNVLCRIGFRLVVAINLLLLAVMSVKPAEIAISYVRFLYRYSPQQPLAIFAEGAPAFQLVGLTLNLYTRKNTTLVTVDDAARIDRSAERSPKPGDLLLASTLTPLAQEEGQLERLYTWFPDWLLRTNVTHWQDRTRIWSIYRFR